MFSRLKVDKKLKMKNVLEFREKNSTTKIKNVHRWIVFLRDK